ncbi:MAG: hypothetical protein IJ272_02660, partial [Clostridia bacterium]|nr:hypothetical protein [Clostridia bacterium]
MKYKYTKKILLSLTVCALAFGINNNVVKAATATINEVGSKYYFYSKSSNSKYGEYYGTSYKSGTAEKYTKYKELLIEGQTKAIAYCVQSTDKYQKASSKYTEISWGSSYGGKVWTEKQALLAGRIIEQIRANITDSKEEYVYTFSALNSLLRLDGSLNFAGYNSGIKKYITEANEYYSSTISPTTTLPAFKVTANNSGVMDSHVPSTASGTTYYTGSINLSNLLKIYGGDAVTYTVTVSSSNGTAAICTTSSCSQTSGTSQKISELTEKTLYIKATNVTPGDKVTIKATANNSSTYKIARLWKHSTAPNTYQALATYSSTSYKRTRNAETALYIPDASKKTFTVEKVDNNDGKIIEGSNLTMTIYEDSTKKTKLASCDITSGKTTCSNTVDNNIATNLHYSITESKAPTGYILGTEISGTWNLASNSETCKKSKIGEENWENSAIADCNTHYIKGNLCYDKVNNTYTEGECEVEIPDTGTEDGTGDINPTEIEDPGTDTGGTEGGDNTGDSEEGGDNTGTTTPEENQFETQ